MLKILTTLFSFIVSLPAWIIAILGILFLSLFDLGKDLIAWAFEQILDLVIYIMNGFSFDFSVFNVNNYLSFLPADMISLISYLKFSQCMTMIIGALTIRIFLQLIPFVRLGS